METQRTALAVRRGRWATTWRCCATVARAWRWVDFKSGSRFLVFLPPQRIHARKLAFSNFNTCLIITNLFNPNGMKTV